MHALLKISFILWAMAHVSPIWASSNNATVSAQSNPSLAQQSLEQKNSSQSTKTVAATTKKVSKKHERNRLLCENIANSASVHGLPKGFFARLLWQESKFNPNAISPKGAMGIAQFMPGTADLRGLDNPFDPNQAIIASANFLKELREQFGNLGLAAAAYNAGPGRVDNLLKNNASVPYETENYVAIITGKSVYDWKKAKDEADETSFKLPKSESFMEGCTKLASRRLVLPNQGLKVRTRLQPWGVQLTESNSAARAFRIYKKIAGRNKILRGEVPMMVRYRNPNFGRRLRYSIRIGAKTHKAAIKKCRKFFAKGLPCLVRKTRR